MAGPTLSNVLVRLCDAAEAVINRPAMPNVEDVRQTTALYVEVVAAVNKPREIESIVSAHEIALADALAHIVDARAANPSRVALWCQVAGVLLPAVREDLFRVMCAERGARVSTTEQTRDGR